MYSTSSLGSSNDSLDGFIVSDGEISSDESYHQHQRRPKKRKLDTKQEAPWNLLPGFLYDPNKDQEVIIGREHECRKIIRMLSQEKEGARPLLIGPFGVGVRSIVKKVAKELEREEAPPTLFQRKVYMIDCKALVAKQINQSKEGYPGVRLYELMRENLSQERPPIIYFRDIQTLLGVEYAQEFLETIFQTDALFIASITEGEDSKETVEALKKGRFTLLNIGEQTEEEGAFILENKIEKAPLFGGACVDQETIKHAAGLTRRFFRSQPFIQTAYQLLNHAAFEKTSSSNGVVSVLPQDTAKIIAEQTGIKAGELDDANTDYLLKLTERLSTKIVGQEEAVARVSVAIRNFKLRLSNPHKPWGVFLFTGPTGVGKTLLGKIIAEELFSSREAFLRIDMSEYGDEIDKNRLIGAPPGYVGHDEGGQLTDHLKKYPQSIVLLDEVEKAHKKVLQVLLQLLDEGRLTDGKGRSVDAKKSCFIMTSNLGSEEILRKMPKNSKEVMKTVEPFLLSCFSPELLNRIHEVIPFLPLHKDRVKEVIILKLQEFARRMEEERGCKLTFSDDIVEHLSHIEVDPRFGLRRLADMVDKEVAKAIGDLLLQKNTRKPKALFLRIERGALSASTKRR